MRPEQDKTKRYLRDTLVRLDEELDIIDGIMSDGKGSFHHALAATTLHRDALLERRAEVAHKLAKLEP